MFKYGDSRTPAWPSPGYGRGIENPSLGCLWFYSCTHLHQIRRIRAVNSWLHLDLGHIHKLFELSPIRRGFIRKAFKKIHRDLFIFGCCLYCLQRIRRYHIFITRNPVAQLLCPLFYLRFINLNLFHFKILILIYLLLLNFILFEITIYSYIQFYLNLVLPWINLSREKFEIRNLNPKHGRVP